MTESGQTPDSGKTLYRPGHPPTNPHSLEDAPTNPSGLPSNAPAPSRPNYDGARGVYVGPDAERQTARTDPLRKKGIGRILQILRNFGKGH